MSLSSKELFHSNFLAWVLMYEKWKDKISEFKGLFEINSNGEIYYVYREKQNFDLLIAYGKLDENISEKLKHSLNVYSDYDDEYSLSDENFSSNDEIGNEGIDDNSFSYEKFEDIQENLKFVVIENKLKSVPTENQLKDYNDKIKKRIRVENFKVKNKNSNKITNKWLYLDSGNTKKYLFAPQMTVLFFKDSAKDCGWKTFSYECYLCKLKQLSTELKDDYAQAEYMILEKYIEMLSVILNVILGELLENDLKNAKAIPDETNVKLLKSVRLSDLYQKLWASSCLSKINSTLETATLKNLKENAAKFTNGTGLMEWKISVKNGEILSGVQIQYRQFRVFAEPAEKERKFTSDSITEIKNFEKKILESLEDSNCLEKLEENPEIKNFKNFKYLYRVLNENSSIEKISELVKRALRLISNEGKKIDSLEFEE